MIKKISLIILIVFYILAGLNHFRSANSYIHIIPTYLPAPGLLNALAGFFEIAFGVMLVFPATQCFAAWGIIAMLIAFLPVHIDMMMRAPVMLGDIKVTPLIAWLRMPLQGLLIWWAWWYTGSK
ncbi:DoxX family protein [Mucilaginibacter sp. PPCGB 2223]|uniref:DoxX family protein n=1 Tax=Mucilaginibacter sp. PPCGB 2223 TaxID=1886027 RepID=UPI000826EC63|nr:DoxX family membrane protein [Mucilaginibacter sp. PPCGB 2223]OCX52941.1 DoxX family protein [Mucilaginibacter sp. PPCGB 2223]